MQQLWLLFCCSRTLLLLLLLLGRGAAGGSAHRTLPRTPSQDRGPSQQLPSTPCKACPCHAQDVLLILLLPALMQRCTAAAAAAIEAGGTSGRSSPGCQGATRGRDCPTPRAAAGTDAPT
jgi:hypothetical protein